MDKFYFLGGPIPIFFFYSELWNFYQSWYIWKEYYFMVTEDSYVFHNSLEILLV